jgi:hypothetical protein
VRRSIALLAIAIAVTTSTGAWGQTAIDHEVGNVRFGVYGAGHLASDIDLGAGQILPNFAYPASDPNARQYLQGFSGILLATDSPLVASHMEGPGGSGGLGEWWFTATGGPEDISVDATRQSVRTVFSTQPLEGVDLPFDVTVEQVSHTWAEGPESNGVVIILTMTNGSELPAENMRMALMTNWDIDPQIGNPPVPDDPSTDMVVWDADRRASIMYDGTGADPTHVATVLLQGALWGHRSVTFPFSPGSLSDSDRFNAVMGTPRVQTAETLTARNYVTYTAAGPVTLEGVNPHTFVFALVGGATRGDLERNIDAIGDVIRRPQAVQTAVNDDGVQLVWEPPMRGDILGYTVFRSLEEGGPYDQVGPRIVDTVEYLDTHVRPGTTYFYTVRPVGLDEKNINTPSTPVSATTSPKPTAISTLAFELEGAAGSPEVALTLQAPSDVTTADVDLLLYRNETGFEPFTVIQQGKFSEELRDVEVQPGRTYYYAVRLVNEFDRLSDISNVTRVEVPLPVAAPSIDLRDVAVYPNPVYRSQGQSLHFRGLPSGTTIRIYTATGERIDRLDNQSSSIFDWKPGSDLANGVYVYQIEWAAEAVSRDPETAPRDTLLKHISGKFVLMD